MLEQTFPCHEQCEQLWITHMLHVTSTIKLFDEIIQFNGANPPQILIGPFGGSIHLFHVHNSGVLINLREKSISRYEGSPFRC